MKYWILAISLFVLGCSGGESGDSDEITAETAETAGAEVADSLNEALDAAANVEKVLEDEKRDVDAAVEDAEGN
jgi:hypothetical protein